MDRTASRIRRFDGRERGARQFAEIDEVIGAPDHIIPGWGR